jgi:NTE family protein
LNARGDLGLVLTGGGARGAYQVGVLRALARERPELEFEVLTGVSAGAINAAFLANQSGNLLERVEALRALWCGLEMHDVLEVSGGRLYGNVARWGLRLLSGGHRPRPTTRGLVDTAPLAELLRRALAAQTDGRLPGIARHLRSGRHQALAITGSSYSTGQSVTWVAGRTLQLWERPNRRAVQAEIRLDHVLASSALPLVFPAVLVDDRWYGDGGVRLTAPLAPAIHLGASRLLTVSTRYARSRVEADAPSIERYPAPAQVAGVLLNAIFLDLVDQDALNLQRINRLIQFAPQAARPELRPVELVVVRPSADLGRLANDYEFRLPRTLRFLTRGLGTREARSNDFLSLLMFQTDYIDRLVTLGERDGERQLPELLALVDGSAA